MRSQSKWFLWLRIATLGPCVALALSGRFPPLHAQSDSAGVQQEKIREIDQHQRESDQRYQKQWDKVNALDSEMTHWQGMVEGFGLLFTVLTSGSIVLQVRKPK